MATTKPTIKMYRGDSYPITFTLTDSATSTAIDLTDCTLTMTVDSLAEPPDDSTQLFQIAGVLDADPATGRVSFTPSSIDTGAVGSYYYDVQLEDGDGNIRTVVKSTISFIMDITK